MLGTVRDANEAVASGATVTLTNVETGLSATAMTDESGDYQFTSVRIGVYKVTAALRGFSTTVVEGVRVVVNARQGNVAKNIFGRRRSPAALYQAAI